MSIPKNLPSMSEIMRQAIENLAKQPLTYNQIFGSIPIRSPNHGRHRKPNSPAYRNPNSQSGSADQGANLTYPFTYTYPLSQSKPIPYAGIRAGEIIGHRVWFLLHESDRPRLCSLTHRFIWEPGQVVEGDITKELSPATHDYPQPLMAGVYSYDSSATLHNDLENAFHWIALGILSHRNSIGNICAGVGGSVYLWGDVVEHEKGYRAQYAKIRSLDFAVGYCDLSKLRKEYGL